MENENIIAELEPAISGCCPNCGNPVPEIRKWRDASGVLVWRADSRGIVVMNCGVCGIDFKMPVECPLEEPALPLDQPTDEESYTDEDEDPGANHVETIEETCAQVIIEDLPQSQTGGKETFDIKGNGVSPEFKLGTVLGLPSHLVRDIAKGLANARRKHPNWPAEPHYGISAIREEFEELWDEVKTDGPVERQRQEAMDLIVTACRYVLEICDRDLES